MKYDKLFLLIWVLLFVFILFSKVKKKRILILVAALVLFIPLLLPRQLWGKWDSIKTLKGKQISKILLLPSAPDWEVNLTDTIEVINDSNKIDQIMDYLRNTEVYFPSHPRRIWETELIFITTNNDSISFQIQKTDNNGTVIYSLNDRWRKDEIADFLERVVNYHQPMRGKRLQSIQ